MEEQAVAEVVKTKALLLGHLMTHPNAGKESTRETFDAYKDYAEIILPTLNKPGKLKDMTTTDKTKLKDTLKKLKKTWAKKPEKDKELPPMLKPMFKPRPLQPKK